MGNRSSINSATVNGQHSGAGAFLPTIELSDPANQGVWNIDGLSYNDLTGTWRLTEKRSAIDVEIPVNLFELADFPNADRNDTIGQPIPLIYGKVRGARAYPTDLGAKEFKFADHEVQSVQRYYNQDGADFAPDSVNLTSSTLIYSGWNDEDTIYVDVTADDGSGVTVPTLNPVDCVKTLLTDDKRGANLATAELNTTAGEGFASDGARVDYVIGTDSRSSKEVNNFEIGLYVDARQKVSDLIDQVKMNTFGYVYVNPSGTWNYKVFEPVPSDGLLEVTETNVKGMLRPVSRTNDPITSAIARYDVIHGLEGERTFTTSDEELRQRRGLTIHSILDATIPINNKLGAQLWTQYQTQYRGRVRRIFEFTGTNELKLLEPGDAIKLNYAPLGIDEAVVIIEVTQAPGALEVGIKATDSYGLRDEPGFWTADSPSFPDDLGGATITAWDDTWSDAQKLWARENIGFWEDGNGYADVSDDPNFSYLASIWS
jgi:hypothetical protein